MVIQQLFYLLIYIWSEIRFKRISLFRYLIFSFRDTEETLFLSFTATKWYTQKPIAVQYSANNVHRLNKQITRTMFAIEFPHSQTKLLWHFYLYSEQWSMSMRWERKWKVNLFIETEWFTNLRQNKRTVFQNLNNCKDL